VTEVHLGCTREEQLRWLKEIWDGTVSLRNEGVDVRAITAWSLLGAYDWNSLVTRADGFYEPGVFDLRSPQPRPTAIARMLSDLATGREPNHPLLDTPGWWHRPERLLYPSVSCRPSDLGKELTLDFGKTEIKTPKSQRLLAIIGARGTLGKAFAHLCDIRGIPYQLLTRQEMDITDPTSVDTALAELNPWAVVNAAGYVRVDDAEREVDACLRANAEGPAILAASCARQGIPLLTFSSDLVFDGTFATPYIETDAVAPLNVYGRSKAEAEVRVLQAHPSALVIRTSAFFGPWDDYNFVTIALRQLAAGQTFVAAEDSVVSPTYVPDLVHTTLDLLIDGEYGLWHLANKGAIAWAELARLAASTAGVDASLVEARPTRELGLTAPRPTYSVLGSERGVLLPSLDNAMSRYFDERQRF
jgi:dTDP-4-dehydrorhamnose reductase